MTASDLLLEIGVEELPASFLDRALEAIPSIATELLGAARLAHGDVRPLGTPRRLALIVSGVAAQQADLSQEVVGPPKRVAMGDDGNLTKAGEGFAKKQGIAPEDLRVVTTDKGEYMAFTRAEKGRPADEVLPEILAELIKRIPFKKSMRWGAGEIAFGRPIHWLLCLHGDRVVPVSFAGVTAGDETRGHRFLAPDEFAIAKVGDYVGALREAHVYVDPAELRTRMTEALAAEAEKLGGTLVEDDFLVDECAGMVEEPFVVPGSFDPSFLALPEGVVISVMRDHQRYFAVRGADGKLMPRYLNVVNTANDPETIAHGNDRVLRARLADAQFFVDEDKKTSLAEKAPKLDSVVWQAKLGSVGDKARRLEALAPFIAPDPLAKLTLEAARLCKVDLVTLMVGEFPELQGEMGSFYVGGGELGTAIREHYLPRGASDDVPQTEAGAALAVADRLDTLVGCFGIGLVPSGSADPFALRRAALGVVRIALEGPDLVLGLRSLVERAYESYPEGTLKPRDEVASSLHEFFRARLKAHFSDGHPTDLVEACLGAWDGQSVPDLRRRIEAVATFRLLPAFESLAVAFKRAHNIAKDAPPGDVDASILAEEAEKELHAAFATLRPKIQADIDKGEYVDALDAVARDLRAPIDRFFEEVFVMVDDERVRDNRLRLLGGIDQTLTGIAHFHELST